MPLFIMSNMFFSAMSTAFTEPTMLKLVLGEIERVVTQRFTVSPDADFR